MREGSQRAKVEGDRGRIAARGITALFTMFWPAVAFEQDSLADPAGSGAIVNAVRWLQGTLLGTVATVVAISR